MTDSRLQELKRAWEASQSVEDEAAYLRERVRVRDLTPEELELAAYCGHQGARAVTGPSLDDSEGELSLWLVGLERFGVQFLVRASLAIASKALQFWQASPPQQAVINSIGPDQVVLALRRFVSAPAQGTRDLIAAQELMDEGTESADEESAPDAWEAWECVWSAAEVVTRGGDPKKPAAEMCANALRLPLESHIWLDTAKARVLGSLAAL